MPDHDSAALLTRQTKRRRVDIGVKRTAGSVTGILLDRMNQSHSPDQDRDCSLVGRGHSGSNGTGEKSNVLRKLLKRANSYEDAMMPFTGATIISQLLKNNMVKNGASDSGFQGSGALSSGGSEIQAEDACSNSSSQDRDSPSNCLSPGPLPSAPPSFGRPLPPSNLNSHTQPLSFSTFDLDRLSDEHLQAKRARVENIIRGMSHSPLVRPSTDDHSQESNRDNNNGHRGDGNSHGHRRSDCASSLLSSPGSRAGGVSAGEVYRENKRKQRLPQQQHGFTQLVCSRQQQRQEERRQLKLQLEDMQKQLRQLQEKFYQIYDSETDEEEENREGGRLDGGGERDEDGNLSEDSIRSDGLEERHRDRGRRRHDDLSELDPGLFLDRARALLRQQALMDREIEEDVVGRLEEDDEERNGERRMKRQGGRQLAETLKQELNCAVSQVVDTVVKGFSLPKQAVSHHHGCHSTPAAPSSSSNSSSSGPLPFGPLPSLTPDPRFGGGAFALNLHSDGSPTSIYHSSNPRLHCFGDIIVPSPLDSFNGLNGRLSGVPTSNDQTEALPLVVRKSGGSSGGGGEENGNPALPPPPPPSHHPPLHPSPLAATLGFSPPSFRHPFPLPLMGYPFHSPLESHGGGTGYNPRPKDHHHVHSSPDSMDMTRETVSLRTKMATLGGGHLGHHHNRQSSPSQHGPEGLSLSLIKSECGDLADMADISPYSSSTTQEGLSPNHLKKAKLMFFYTRYPSSNMLKIFFSDVKFNRCITSQLIKWFSNFREFYYIQMEKYARQAINEGVTAVEDLAVGRDSEIFRALNMHYNKANDFEVPDRFLEVAQVTLREFFNAIVAGKDADPSWKKAIYKVICKLDSEVPETFKSPNCLQELLHD
ncbi:prospero homeobox protein 1a isoform X1 [Phyllopteryx taeniolatus]|uniref:prospero homeobox protein 1a isoform X1 n=1 Tax=Phyllopteryx taeniolatus TaxID=161469 RepID=UPI002AD2F1DB|nr:prospero homeobox protein 1a isoform X1 [Phyllopteryx taeniolatus]